MSYSTALELTYDELIFAHRHQAYGAFDLRQNYKPTLTRALGLGVGLFLLSVSAPTLYARFWPHQAVSEKSILVDLDPIRLAEKPVEPPITLPPVEKAPSVNTVRNLPPEVMPEADVIEESLPPTTDELKDATSGEQTAEGTGDLEVIAPPESAAPTVAERAIEITPKPDEVFVRVEQDPEYPGGIEALRTFLGSNLRYPRAASSAGISGKVYVSFVINTDGSLTDLQILKGLGFGCDEEALRVMQKMPRWKPGKQSGHPVRVRFNMPIVFTLE